MGLLSDATYSDTHENTNTIHPNNSKALSHSLPLIKFIDDRLRIPNMFNYAMIEVCSNNSLILIYEKHKKSRFIFNLNIFEFFDLRWERVRTDWAWEHWNVRVRKINFGLSLSCCDLSVSCISILFRFLDFSILILIE